MPDCLVSFLAALVLTFSSQPSFSSSLSNLIVTLYYFFLLLFEFHSFHLSINFFYPVKQTFFLSVTSHFVFLPPLVQYADQETMAFLKFFNMPCTMPNTLLYFRYFAYCIMIWMIVLIHNHVNPSIS